MGLAPSMIHAFTEDVHVSSQENDVMNNFELPSIVLFMPEYSTSTIIAMLVPINGNGKYVYIIHVF